MGQELITLIILIAIGIYAFRAQRSRFRRDSNEGSFTYSSRSSRSGGTAKWQVSQNGNPTMSVGQMRITVFPLVDEVYPQGNPPRRVWIYCVAYEDNDDDPYFSDPYETEEAAKYEALAFINGSPSRHQSETELRNQRRIDRPIAQCEGGARQREQLIAEISDMLKHENLNVTALRKPEKRIASQLKALEWQIPQCHYYPDGDRENAIALAEKQKIALHGLAQRVEARIAERKAKGKSPPQK